MTAETEPRTSPAEPGVIEALLPALRRLDALLERAVARAEVAYGPEAARDRYRGLYIGTTDVERLLAREPGAPLLCASNGGGELDDGAPWPGDPERSRLAWLAATFDLTPFDMDVAILALAPELDLRYERLYAYLQDDVTRRRPTVDLALHLLCNTAEERVMRRAHFAPDAPLVRSRLLELVTEGSAPRPPLLAHALRLDEQITSLLLGDEALDRRLARCCRYVQSAPGLSELALPDDTRAALALLASRAVAAGEPLRLYLHGPRGGGKALIAAALAASVRFPLLEIELAQLLEIPSDFDRLLPLAMREGWLHGAVVHLRQADLVLRDGPVLQRVQLCDAIARQPGITILSGVRPWVPSTAGLAGVVEVPLHVPDVPQRRVLWQRTLSRAGGVPLSADCLDTLAARFRLTPRQIECAVAAAGARAAWRAAARAPSHAAAASVTPAELLACARGQRGHELAALASRVEPTHDWDDLVLPEDEVAQLRELGDRVAHRHRVLGEWEFGARLSRGKGVNALFSGPSGTGKTMAAEVIARSLGLDLYRVELAGVVSKYIGETEKNLDRVFDAAELADGILFFDEADALFGKRSEVRDSHDRYANLEISYLLQKMEQYEGVAILATNLLGNLDTAFARRFAFTVHFPFPDEASRRRIWERMWPPGAPRGTDIDLDALARLFKLSGGNIRNVTLAAAFLAAADSGTIGMRHVVQAIRREYQKLGKTLTAGELGPYADGAAANEPGTGASAAAGAGAGA